MLLETVFILESINSNRRVTVLKAMAWQNISCSKIHKNKQLIQVVLKEEPRKMKYSFCAPLQYDGGLWYFQKLRTCTKHNVKDFKMVKALHK